MIKIITKDFEYQLLRLEEINTLKNECDLLRRDFIASNKSSSEIIEKLKSENFELKLSYENIRSTEISKIEENSKHKIDHLRSSINEKDEIIMRLKQDINILKPQMEILEKNLQKVKDSSKENE